MKSPIDMTFLAGIFDGEPEKTTFSVYRAYPFVDYNLLKKFDNYESAKEFAKNVLYFTDDYKYLDVIEIDSEGNIIDNYPVTL